jgi:hypothetical protein
VRILALFALGTLVLPGSLWGQNQDSVPEKKFKRQPNVIVRLEIAKIANETNNAYDVVQRLRPQFLRARGATSLGGTGRTTSYARVLVDGVPRGELDALRQVPVLAIEEISYLSATDASIRFGTGYDGGAILVKTRAR